MLDMTLQPGREDEFTVGEALVKIKWVRRGKVRLGVDAPPEVKVRRGPRKRQIDTLTGPRRPP